MSQTTEESTDLAYKVAQVVVAEQLPRYRPIHELIQVIATVLRDNPEFTTMLQVAQKLDVVDFLENPKDPTSDDLIRALQKQDQELLPT